MHLAILHKNIELAKCLLKNGGDPNAMAAGEKFKGMTPLRFAKELVKSSNDPHFIAVVELIRSSGGHE
jgi:ankyrin repeat protein